MNKVVLMGRLTRDPDVRYSQGETPLAIARYTLAVDRRFKRNGEQDADFINCVAFGRTAEFAEKYLKQGTKMVVSGRIQTGSYTNRDGVKVYTTEVVIEDEERAAMVEKVQAMITTAGAAITNVDEWGKKQLAYEIQKMKEGYYYFIQFEGETTVPAELEERLRIEETVLRFLCVKQDA